MLRTIVWSLALTAALSGYAVADQIPVGYHDGSDCSFSTGWACDPDNYSQAVSIHFYADGPYGQGTLVGTASASATREAAVGAQCGGNVNHGFTFATPASLKDGKQHDLYAYAINLNVNNNPLLSGSPKTITCAAPADTTPPTVTVAPPNNGAILSGTVNLTATAFDNVGVSGVAFYVDVVRIGGATTAPYVFPFDTTRFADGAHILYAKAYDAVDNVGTSATVSVKVFNDDLPIGNHESSDCSVSRGWACDPDDYSLPVAVNFYADGPAGQGTLVGTASASATREDAVGAQCGGNVNHGFTFATPASLKDGRSHAIYVQAVNLNAGRFPTITGAIKTITCATDTTPPTVSIISPAAGAVLSSTVTVTLSASDNVGVSTVAFYVDGGLKGIGACASSCTFPLYTLQWLNGTHTLFANAYDAAGNVGMSSSVTVTIINTVADVTPPTVAVTAPANGAALSGTVTVTATASDTVGVSTVAFLVDGWPKGECTDTSAPFTCSLDTTMLANATHILTATAYDAANNSASASVNITVNNTAVVVVPPTVAFTAPANGATVSGTANITVSASASVSGGVSRVEFYVDGALKFTDTAAPYAFSLDTTQLSNGTRTLSATAYDAANKSASASVSVTVSNGAAAPADVYAFTLDTTQLSSGAHALFAKAYDAAGNASTSTTVSVMVSNAALPTVSITAPAAGAVLSSTVNVTASASDAGGVSKVEFYIDEVLKDTDTVAPYAFSFDTTLIANATHTLSAKAYGAAGSASAAVTVTVFNDHLPVGNHDGSDCSVSTGWACDPDGNSLPVDVHFYADGPAGQGTLVGTAIASATRETAVGTLCGGNANHGFSFPTPASLKDGKKHDLYAYAINLNVNSNPLLSSSPKTITCGASASGEAEIGTNADGSSLTIRTTARLAGAIGSLQWRGYEFINADDHGRALQSASSFDGYGECYNPTEAGSNADSGGAATTSRLQSISATPTSLQTTTQMAFWLKSGETGTCPSGAGATTPALSDHILKKTVALGANGDPHLISYSVEFDVPQDYKSATFEALTGYLGREFSAFYTFDPLTKKALSRTASDSITHMLPFGDGMFTSENPVILATVDGAYAMGVFADQTPDGRIDYYSGWDLRNYNTTKWNFAYSLSSGVATGAYRFHAYVVVGSLAEVVASMGRLEIPLGYAGNLDGVTNSTISGWTCYRDGPNPAGIQLYAGGPAASGSLIGTYLVDQPNEQAVSDICKTSGNHRFTIPLSAETVQKYAGQKIYLYPVAPAGTTARPLANSGQFAVPPGDPTPNPSCTTPSGLSAAATSSSRIALSWQASAGARAYKIYRDGVQVAVSATNSHADNGLTQLTRYAYEVAAYDAVGNVSSRSAAASAVTLAGPGLSVSSSSAFVRGTEIYPQSLTSADVTADVVGNTLKTTTVKFRLSPTERNADGSFFSKSCKPSKADCRDMIDLDAMVGQIKGNGWSLLPVFEGLGSTNTTVLQSDIDNYVDFVDWFVSRYKTDGNIRRIELINAPLTGFITDFNGTEIGTGEQLLTLTNKVYDQIKNKHPDVQVGTPGFEYHLIGDNRIVARAIALTEFFLDKSNGAQFDFWAFHGYHPGGSIIMTHDTNAYAGIPGILAVRRKLDANGWQGRPIIDTEHVGIAATGPTFSADDDKRDSGYLVQELTLKKTLRSGGAFALGGLMPLKIVPRSPTGESQWGSLASDGSTTRNVKAVGLLWSMLDKYPNYASRVSGALDTASQVWIEKFNSGDGTALYVFFKPYDTTAGAVTIGELEGASIGLSYTLALDMPQPRATLTDVYGSTKDVTSNISDGRLVLDVSSLPRFLVVTENAAVSLPAPVSVKPTVSFSAPAPNADVSGDIKVAAAASDAVGVSKVEFYIDNILKNTATAAPYSFSLNSAQLMNSSHTITAVAYDTAGSSGPLTAISVQVRNQTRMDAVMTSTGGALTTSEVIVAFPASAVSSQTAVVAVTDSTDDAASLAERATAAKLLRYAPMSSGVKLLPYGMRVNSPVGVLFPLKQTGRTASAAGSDLLFICVWDADAKTWKRLPTLYDPAAQTLEARSATLSVFKVFSLAPAVQTPDSARLLEGYLYPNPCKGRCRPTIHAETDAAAERVEVRILNLAGELVDTLTLTNPTFQAGKYAFEAPWQGADRVPSGVYMHVMRAFLNGRETKPLRGRFALIK